MMHARTAVPKVSSFVVDRDRRLLVFTHPTAPEAGIQVPAGTIERDENPAVAAVRETEEETGYRGFAFVRFIDRQLLRERRNGCEELHDRWFFQLAPPECLPERWRHGEGDPAGGAESWIPFDFFWIDAATEPSPLTPDHAAVLQGVLTS